MHPGYIVLLSTIMTVFVLLFIQEWRAKADIVFEDRPTRSVLYSISLLWITGLVTGLTAVVFSTELSIRILGAASSAAFGFTLAITGWMIRRRHRLFQLTAALAAILLALSFWVIW